MAQISALIQTLKQALKQRGMTYATVARDLSMSEANIKRMFAAKRFTLERLEQICALLHMELTDLVKLYEDSRQQITHLTEEQEKEVIGDEKLLLVAVSVRNHLCFEDIINNYHITEPECIRCLARLDKLKIIDLLPNNRIKLRIDENFRWIPNGPIDRFFETQIKNQFLKSRFSGELDQRLFLFGLLSDASVHVLKNKIHALSEEFAELHRHDAKLPLDKRHNVGFMLAMRPWELGVLEPLRKKDI